MEAACSARGSIHPRATRDGVPLRQSLGSLPFFRRVHRGFGKPDATLAMDDREVVFVGYGIQAPEYGWDDFKGLDLRGKVLLMMNNDPADDPKLFEGKRRLYYGRWDYKYESAARQGAVGAIIIHTTESAGYPFSVVQTSWTGEQFELRGGSGPRLDMKGWLSDESAKKLVAASGTIWRS